MYANVVHAKSFSSIETRHRDIDIVVIRENTEGEYSAMSHEAIPGVVEALKVCTRANTERIAEYAFQATWVFTFFEHRNNHSSLPK